MRVGFAFFKAKHGGPFSKAITWRTGGPYSHVEFYLRDQYAVIEEGTGIKRELCFSSYEGDGGVRVKHIHLDHRWDCLEYDLPEAAVTEAWAWGASQIGKGYDWAGIMGFVNPWRKGGDPGRWFCSEICHVLALRLNLVAPNERSDKVSPRRLYDLLMNGSTVPQFVVHS